MAAQRRGMVAGEVGRHLMGRDCLMAAEEEGKQMHQSRMMEEVGALLLQGRERHSQLHQQAERAGEDSQLHRAEVVQL